MRPFVEKTAEVEVVIAPAPVAESSDSTHWARALLLQREVE
jgi:hypothetical protein